MDDIEFSLASTLHRVSHPSLWPHGLPNSSRPWGWGKTMPGGLIVRRAGPADACPLAALVHLVHSNSPPFQSVDDIARFLADPCNFQIVAEEENRPVSSMTMPVSPLE